MGKIKVILERERKFIIDLRKELSKLKNMHKESDMLKQSKKKTIQSIREIEKILKDIGE